jgi:hypothetical protein
MNFYQTKTNKLPGSNYSEVKSRAYLIFKQIKSKTKRKPYIKSAYFNKQKIERSLRFRLKKTKGQIKKISYLVSLGNAMMT